MEALKKMASPTSLVIRGGADNAIEVSSSEIVPGDLVLLSQGDRIPAGTADALLSRRKAATRANMAKGQI